MDIIMAKVKNRTLPRPNISSVHSFIIRTFFPSHKIMTTHSELCDKSLLNLFLYLVMCVHMHESR